MKYTKILLKVYSVITLLGILMFVADPLIASLLFYIGWPLFIAIIFSLCFIFLKERISGHDSSSEALNGFEKILFTAIITAQIFALVASYEMSNFKFM